VLASGTLTVVSGLRSVKFCPLAQTSATQLCLLSAQTSQSTINVIFLLSDLNFYRLVISFIAFIHAVCCLKLYFPETMQMGCFFLRMFQDKANRDYFQM